MTKSWMCLAKYYSHFSDTLHFQTVPGNGFREEYKEALGWKQG